MGKFIDLTGQRFGRLTVIERAENSKSGEAKWLCECDCGNVISTRASLLKNGRTQSCGCLRLDRIHESAFNDLTGHRFGRLVALEHIRKGNRTYWRCICDCGTETIVEAYNLKHVTRSCGCLHKETTHDTHFKDITGEQFNRLTVLRFAYHKNHQSHWECLCTCGKTTVVSSYNLREGLTKSCGCLAREEAVSRKLTHGASNTRLYRRYHSMLARCYNPNNKSYSRYGGRGITVCEEWRNSFETFRDWCLANGYEEGKSIDRINNSLGYDPANCRFTGAETQANNRRSNRIISAFGKTGTVAELSKEYSIDPSLVWKRLQYGWDTEKALTIPADGTSKFKRFVIYNEKTMTIKEAAQKYNLSYGLLWKRLNNGWDIETALLTPARSKK